MNKKLENTKSSRSCKILIFFFFAKSSEELEHKTVYNLKTYMIYTYLKNNVVSRWELLMSEY